MFKLFVRRPLHYVTGKTSGIFTVPLNVGYIAAFMQEYLPDVNIEIYKDPVDIVKRLRDGRQKYDVLGLSCYEWNKNLNKHVFAIAKESNSELITVAGGPNIDFANEPHAVSDNYSNVDYYIK